MTRGRRALPDEIKALKGNPGKRKLVLGHADEKAGPIKAPAYISTLDEKQIFARVADELSRVRFIKTTDADALGRWCVYLAKWVSIKKRLQAGKKNADVYYETESKHGKMLRVHPLFASLFKIEQHLMALEDRIGLNPSSRQAILRGIINAPNIPAGGMFDEAEKPQAPLVTEADRAKAEHALGPLGFLGAAKH